VTPDQDPAHTSSRRPLQFITSLNLTPSLEGRIYGIKKATSGSADDSEIQPVSQSDDDDSVPGALQDDDDDDCPAGAVVQPAATFPRGVSDLPIRNWNGATTTRPGKRTRARARVSPAAAVMRGSGKGAFRMRHAGGKPSSAHVVPRNPFEYVPLPLQLLKTPSRAWRIGASSAQHCAQPPLNPVRLGPGQGRARTARTCADILKNQFQTDVSRRP
jgi:hypothetical protein